MCRGRPHQVEGGLDHGGDVFKVFFVQAHNADTGTNPTDVYAADATP